MTSPKLRFKEFDRDWFSKKIIELADYVDYRGKTPKKVESGILLVTAKNIKQGYLDYSTSQEFIEPSEFEEVMRRGKVEINDVLITTEAPLGNVASVDRTDIALAQRVIKYRGKEKLLDNLFLKQKFLSESFQEILKSKATGGTVQGIKGSVLHQIDLIVPSKEEQTKIASFLSAVDEKISQLTQKHSLLNQYKQGMMQKLFSQQIRFKANDGSEFGEWVNKKIIEIADYVDYRGKTPKKVDEGILLVTAKNIRFGYIDYDVSREYISSDDFEEVMRRGIAEIGDVLITTEAPLGNVASVDREDIALAQRVIKYRGKEGILNNSFLKQKFLSEDFQALITSKATGGTVQGIKGSTLHSLEISIPKDVEEQTKIAHFLSAIDQKIEVVAQQIEQAKQWKKGLLQQMFV